jgi:hypothetical protein
MKQSTKDWIQYSTAIAMVASAIVIAFLAFIITSTIESGVLIYIAQALCYAGGIFGVSIYFKNKMGEFESNAKEQIEHMVNDIMGNK